MSDQPSLSEAIRRPPPPPRMGVDELGTIHPDERIHGVCRTIAMHYVKMAEERGVTVTSITGSTTASKIRADLWVVLAEAHKFRMLKAFANRDPESPEPIDEAHLDEARRYCTRMWGSFIVSDYLNQVAQAMNIPWGTFNRLST